MRVCSVNSRFSTSSALAAAISCSASRVKLVSTEVVSVMMLEPFGDGM